MVGASLRHFCLSILFAICCHSQSIGTLESFNWTCALPVEESTPLNDTVAGQWMIHSLFDAIESAAADSNALSEKVCSNRSGVDKLICKRIVVDALENMVSGSCSDFSLDNISEICQSTPPGRFCMIENDPDNTSQSCVMRDSNGVGISLDCPPGFYCLGTIYQPRACPKGSFCPNNASRPLSCPEGMFCPVAAINVSCGEDSSYVKSSSILKGSMCMPDKDNRTILPEPCPKGNYCQHGKNYSCGEGDYCPLGAAVGQHCDFLEECPHGSSKPGRLWKVLLVSSVLLAIAFLMVYKVDLWCMTRDRRWLRILFALIALSSIWVAEHQMQDPTYAPVFMLTGFFSCLLWGMIVVPQVSKRVTSGLARKTIDGVFFVSVALLAWIGCEDVYTGVFVAVFIPCGWCFWVALVDEHSDGPSKSTYCGMDGADRKKFLVMVFVCSLGVILLAACCNVDLAFVYLSFSLLICFDITFRILYQKLESCCKREIQRPPDDPGQSLMENGEVMHRRSTETNGTRNSEDSILHLSSTSFQAATEDQHKRVGISIRFRHVTLEVPTKKAGDWKKIMNNITLSIPAGESVAIMGPSGCGKSTLVKVLSGRANYGKISGKIIINEQDGLQIQEIQNLVGFVPQDDVMHRNLTVREIVKFQASLRMPNSDGATREHRVETLVQSLLDILGLNRGDVPDTPIGGEENEPGVSGGQRKRVSIAMELAAEPKLLLLDEPTSGLDSTTSESVIRQIVDYSRNNRCTSLAVIHQPRYSMLNMFDRVIFLSVGGFLVYSGRTGDWCKQYFVGTLGVSIPTEANPADIFLDEITPREGEDVEEKGKGFAQKWSRYLKSSLNEFEPLERMLVDVPASGEKCTWGDEIFLQMQRAMLQMRKSWAQVLANNVMLVLGLICLCVGAPPKQPFDDFVHTSLALFLLMLTQGVAAQRIFGGPEKVVGWREYGASINLALYFVGRDITAFLEMFFGTVLFCMIYWPFGPLLISLRSMMWVSFSFVFAVWGLNYIWSVLLFGGGAQMMAVVCSFVSFLFAGVQPQFVPLSQMVHSQGIYIMAVSPIRWAHGSFMSGHILGAETAFSNELVQYMVKGNLFALGYPLNWITENNWTFAENYVPVKDLWEGQMRTDDFHEDELSEKSFIRPPIAFVNKPKQLLLLGLFFRFVGFVFLLATAKRNYSGGGPFLQSQNKLVAHFNRNVFRLLCVIFTNCMMAILIRTI